MLYSERINIVDLGSEHFPAQLLEPAVVGGRRADMVRKPIERTS
jgi:hypothetical protein